jgi:hypothetical protein
VTRSQALTIGLLMGGVLLVFTLLLVFVIVDPFETFLPPTATPTPAPPTITPTPTLPSFLPTPAPEVPEPEPTATFTRVPTATPRPPVPPTPTVVLSLPTLPVRPTATAVIVEEPVFIPPTPTDTPAPTLVPSRRYSVDFRAQDSTIDRGDCTDLEWRTEGVLVVTLNGQEVSTSGRREVCPTENREYELRVQLPDGLRYESRTVRIRVEDN